MGEPSLHLKILGCRGSYSVSGEEFNEVGGLTPSILIEVDDKAIILDAGSGLQRYNPIFREKSNSEIYLFLSHLHLDHICGFVGFLPIYRANVNLHIFGPNTDGFDSLEQALTSIFSPPFHPLSVWETRAKKIFYDIVDGDTFHFISGESTPLLNAKGESRISVQCIRNYSHPKSGVTIFCVKFDEIKIIYATDCEGKIDTDPRIAEFAQNCDLLIHDAMYTEEKYNHTEHPTRGYGHSTVNDAASMAKRSNAKKLLLFHHDPESSDEDLNKNLDLAREIFGESYLARDGDSYYF